MRCRALRPRDAGRGRFSWRRGRSLGCSDFAHHAGERETIELSERQADENLDAIVEHPKHVTECVYALDVAAFNRGRIRRAPVGRDRLAWPYRTDFTRDLVADGEHEIQPG